MGQLHSPRLIVVSPRTPTLGRAKVADPVAIVALKTPECWHYVSDSQRGVQRTARAVSLDRAVSAPGRGP
jgi:hypothetical protein